MNEGIETMLGYQAFIEDTNGKVIEETEVYDGACYFMMTVTEMVNRLQKGQTVVIERVAKHK